MRWREREGEREWRERKREREGGRGRERERERVDCCFIEKAGVCFVCGGFRVFGGNVVIINLSVLNLPIAAEKCACLVWIL